MTIAIERPTRQPESGSAIDQLMGLQAGLEGELLLPEHDDYDAARTVVDFRVDRRPLAIVRVASAHDISATIRFARQHGYALTVRSGGHSMAAYSMIDDGVVIDLTAMKGIVVDPVARIARVQAGANSGDLAQAVGTHGLALSTGDSASVGMGGLMTGGGIGLMVRKYGLAIDNLLAAQVVTADGAIVTASAEEHPDLFWAIRGGGGNFGVVTEFTVRLAPVGLVYGGILLLPADRAVVRGYLDTAAAAPDGLTLIASLMPAPPFPFVPQERIGELVLSILVCYTGEIADGERAVAPLRALATPIADLVQPLPYPALYQFTELPLPQHAASIRSMFTDDLSDATIDAILAAFSRAASPFSTVQLRGLGGAMGRVAPESTAFAHRERRFLVAVLAAWFDPSIDGAPIEAWVNGLWQEIKHERAGVYANFLEREGEERIKEAYPGATHARLAAIKAQYDPTNFFCLNQNIAPK